MLATHSFEETSASVFGAFVHYLSAPTVQFYTSQQRNKNLPDDVKKVSKTRDQP